jgi:hypothetical protein
MALYLKNNEITSSDITSTGVFKQKYNRDGLILHLDATDVDSYPGSGTTWFDLSPLGNNFEINPSAFNSSTSTRYMDFNGSYGCAKKQNTDLIVSGNVTVCLWTRVKNSTSEWRTLLRGRSSGDDHQVIIQSGGWSIGMYDNTNGTGFNSSGFSQQSLPGYPNDWVFMVWRFFDAEMPHYELGYNDTASLIRGSINSVNSRFKHGFCSIGAYNNGSQNDVNNASQYWGDISMISVYNRILNPYEILENYNATVNNYF